MTAKPRWKTVLFDMDGTLANTVEVIVRSHQHAVREVLGQEFSEERVRGWIGMTLVDTFTALDPAHAAELEAAYRQFNESHLDEYVTGYPGVPEIVADLVAADVKVGVVTSRRRDTTVLVAPLAGLPEDLILASTADDTAKHKPNPDPLLHGLEVVGADASDAVYVGDAIFDLQAAAAAGMAGIGVTWGAGQRAELEAQPNVAVVNDAAQLREVLFTAEA